MDEVRDLDPSRNVLVSFICLNDFMAWFVVRSCGIFVSDLLMLELYELLKEGSDPSELPTDPYLKPLTLSEDNAATVLEEKSDKLV